MRLEQWAEKNRRLLRWVQLAGLLATVALGLGALGLLWLDRHRQAEEGEWIVKPFNHTAPSVRVR